MVVRLGMTGLGMALAMVFAASVAFAQGNPVPGAEFPVRYIPDNEFLMFGTRNPPPGALNFWTLNCPEEGPAGGCFGQWDIAGKLGGGIGTCSGLFHRFMDPNVVSKHCDSNTDQTAVITSTRGLRMIIGNTGVPQEKTVGAGLLTLDEKGNVSVTAPPPSPVQALRTLVGNNPGLLTFDDAGNLSVTAPQVAVYDPPAREATVPFWLALSAMGAMLVTTWFALGFAIFVTWRARQSWRLKA